MDHIRFVSWLSQRADARELERTTLITMLDGNQVVVEYRTGTLISNSTGLMCIVPENYAMMGHVRRGPVVGETISAYICVPAQKKCSIFFSHKTGYFVWD